MVRFLDHVAIAVRDLDGAKRFFDLLGFEVADAVVIQGEPFSQQAAMAKLFSTEHAWKICDIALQVHGGYGYVRDFPVERALRDVRVTRIYEGTSEIQRIVIARNLLRSQ